MFPMFIGLFGLEIEQSNIGLQPMFVFIGVLERNIKI